MASKIDKTNLGYLDIDYQYKLVKCFMEDTGFFARISSIVDQNSFTDPKLKIFVGTLKDYYANESVVPTYETIGYMLKDHSKSQIELEEWVAVIKKISRDTSTEGWTLVKDIALKFFKQQAYTIIANKIIDKLKKGDLDSVDECGEMFARAEMIGQDDEYGNSPYDLESQALSRNFRVNIPTGIIPLDNDMNGGLAKKCVGLIIGPAGFGKTSMSTAIASYAATYECEENDYSGFKVLQIFFEDQEVDIAKKHFSRITGYETRFLVTRDELSNEKVRETIDSYQYKESIKKNLRLKRFPTGVKSASDIAVYIKKIINSGFKPDLVIIDYFECLAPESGGYSSDSKWDREGNTMRRIERMASELDIAIWLPTQGNKGSINSPEVVTMDQAGGSIMKVQVAHVVLSIARSLDDIDKSKASLSILKNRLGKSGHVLANIKFDNGTSRITCDEVQEFDNQASWKEMEEKINGKK